MPGIEKLLEGEMDAHWGYEKNAVVEKTPVIPGWRRIQTEHGEAVIPIITNNLKQAAQKWQNRPLDPVYLCV